MVVRDLEKTTDITKLRQRYWDLSRQWSETGDESFKSEMNLIDKRLGELTRHLMPAIEAPPTARPTLISKVTEPGITEPTAIPAPITTESRYLGEPINLTGALKRLYPQNFVPEETVGISLVDLTAQTLKTIQGQIDADPEAWLADLRTKGMPQEEEALLMELGATQEDLDNYFGVDERQKKLAGLVDKTLPGYDLSKFENLLETDWDGFVAMMRMGGRTKEKEDLLQIRNASAEHCDKFFPAPDITEREIPPGMR